MLEVKIHWHKFIYPRHNFHSDIFMNNLKSLTLDPLVTYIIFKIDIDLWCN